RTAKGCSRTGFGRRDRSSTRTQHGAGDAIRHDAEAIDAARNGSLPAHVTPYRSQSRERRLKRFRLTGVLRVGYGLSPAGGHGLRGSPRGRGGRPSRNPVPPTSGPGTSPTRMTPGAPTPIPACRPPPHDVLGALSVPAQISSPDPVSSRRRRGAEPLDA